MELSGLHSIMGAIMQIKGVVMQIWIVESYCISSRLNVDA